jgi:hypothetical protein
MNPVEEKKKKITFYCEQAKDVQTCQESKKILNKKI